MEKTVIGIKVADGSYYPILAKDEDVRKKVILTTVKDQQKTVQIDLYQGLGEKMAGAQYIGSLMIDQIEGTAGGEPEIELILGFDQDGNLMSKARDLKSDAQQSLAVNLQELPEESIYDIPEFQMEDGPGGIETAEAPDAGTDFGEDFNLDLDMPSPAASGREGSVAEMSSVEEPRRRVHARPAYDANGYTNEQLLRKTNGRSRLPLFIGAAALAIVVLLLFLIGPWRLIDQISPAPIIQQAAQQPAEPQVVAPQPVQPDAPTPPTPAAKPESVGVWYTPVRGDNLWNLSKSFYQNPRLYRRIVEENAISDPDLIFAGQRLYIPDVETGRR